MSHIYSDNDVSAFSGAKRPRFEDMLDAIKRGEYDALLCWHTDRLYRSIKDMERVIEVCEAADVPIRSVNGGDLDVSNATGKMMARILGSVSRMESEHKAERQKRANIQRAESGTWWSSNRPFGYNPDHTINESEAVLIRQAAADVLAGVSLRAIRREWTDRGIVTVRGGKWTGPGLLRMLQNPRLAALRTYHGKVVGEGNWPAILDVDTHRGVVAVLSDTQRKTGTVRFERKYLGSYRYLCGHADESGRECGAMMMHTFTKHKDGRRYDKYRCSEHSHLGRAQVELDAHVERVALTMMVDTTKVAKILAAKTAAPQDDPQVLRTRRAALAAQKDELATLFTDGVLDGPSVRRESAKLQTKIAAIDSALADMARRSPLAELVSQGMATLEQRWEEMTPDVKGKIIDELFTVVVKPSPLRRPGRYFNPDLIDFREPRR